MKDLRSSHNAVVNRFFLIALLGHLPLMLLAAYFFETSLGQALWFSLAILAGPLLAYLWNKEANLTNNVMAVAGICFSGLLIHLGKGMIEMHFHIFMFLATLTIYGQVMPIVSATLAVVVHHLGFFFFLPQSIFNYEASIWIVLLHAAFVVAEDIGLFYIARKMGNFIVAQGTSLIVLDDLAKKNLKDSDELNDSVVSLAALTQQQAASTAEMNAGFKDVRHRVEENSVELQQSVAIVGDVQEQSQQAMQSMNNMSQSMGDINQSVSGLGEIEEIMRQIGEKLGVINDIVFKTQLLSFNASIEAARAGQHGRGFAVVAEEVGSLALSSGNASREIQALLESSGSKVNQIVNSIQAKVEGAVSTTEQTNQQFRKVYENLHEVGSMVQRVGERNRYFLDSFLEFNRALEQLQSSSDQNDTVTQNVQRLAANSRQASEKLEKILKQTRKQVASTDFEENKKTQRAA